MSHLIRLSSIAAFEIVTVTPDKIVTELWPYGTIPLAHVDISLKSPVWTATN